MTPTVTFADIAKPMIARGVPMIPLKPKSKLAFLKNWTELASTDPAVINQWDLDFPGANGACVAFARPGGFWFLEIDKEGFAKEIERQTGQKIPATFMVRSSPGRGHLYFRQTPASILMNNRQGRDANGKEAWSARVNARYVVSAGSAHPTSGRTYEVLLDHEIVEAPDWLVEWCSTNDQSQQPATKTGHAELDAEEPIPSGSRNSTLTSILGKARQVLGMDKEQLYEYGKSVNEKRCHPPLADSEVRTIANSIGRYEVYEAPKLMLGGKVMGQEPHQVQTDPAAWRGQFRNLSEMEQGDITMLIDGVLQEGLCFIGAAPASGKTWIALAFAKAICTGEPLFGIPEYSVPGQKNVIYLIPEVSDKAFRKRGETMRLPKDDRFIVRTISQGAPLALSDPSLMEAVRQLKPVVFLDTASRFLQANDENSAAQNRLLVNDIIALRAAGAVCVVILHHAKKGEKKEAMSLETMLRGTSDFGAMCDQAYGIRVDEHLYNRGAGPLEIELANLKDRERLGGLTSIRLASTYRKPGCILPVSYLDETGNFHPVEYKDTQSRVRTTLIEVVTENPMISVAEIEQLTGIKPYTSRGVLKSLEYHRTKGGPDGVSPWHRDEGSCPYGKTNTRRHNVGVDLGSPGSNPAIN